jgi:preprotein translocase subunit YajC
MLETIVYAIDNVTTKAVKAPTSSSWGAFLPLIIIFAIFYFLLILPQQKRTKKHKQMLEQLRAGEEIVTSGGICGRIDSVLDQGFFLVEIAKGVKIKVAKNAIATVIKPEIQRETK